MNATSFAVAGLLTFALALGGAGAVAGDKKKEHEHDIVREALQRGEVLPLVKILAIAEQHVPGDIIEVELEQEGDSTKPLIYEIKVLTKTGRVREIKIDARTGAVLTIEDD